MKTEAFSLTKKIGIEEKKKLCTWKTPIKIWLVLSHKVELELTGNNH